MDTVRRGYEPKDFIEFGLKSLGKLNAAAQELRYLLNRGKVFTFAGIRSSEGKMNHVMACNGCVIITQFRTGSSAWLCRLIS